MSGATVPTLPPPKHNSSRPLAPRRTGAIIGDPFLCALAVVAAVRPKATISLSVCVAPAVV